MITGITAFAILMTLLIGIPVTLGVFKLFGVYTTVLERQCRVYVLFGNVLGVIREPGFHWLFPKLGWQACLVNWLGKCYVMNLALDQEYLRSQPVNSEEGAPMGIGVWYEMSIIEPVAFLFANADPRGSLRANVGNATVRSLSNMALSHMLETRHQMSQAVRNEVSVQAHQWGYQVGSVYIRKVHFRNYEMIAQIEEKVINRLRQVTSAIRQDGANQVSVITSSAEKTAASEFARAASIRPRLVGEALQQIAVEPAVLDALFTILEVKRLVQSSAELILVPRADLHRSQLSQLVPSPNVKTFKATPAADER